MGLASRDITVSFRGHELALSARLEGAALSTARYKLYIDSELADEQKVPVWSAFFGGTVTLRAKLPGDRADMQASRVKVIVTLRVLRRSDYVFFVNDEQVHRERASYGGM